MIFEIVVILLLLLANGYLASRRLPSSPPDVRGSSSVPSAAPAVAALEFTSDVIIKVFRLPQGSDAAVTEADVAAMIAAGTAAGVFEPAERRIVERVFRLDDEPVTR